MKEKRISGKTFNIMVYKPARLIRERIMRIGMGHPNILEISSYHDPGIESMKMKNEELLPILTDFCVDVIANHDFEMTRPIHEFVGYTTSVPRSQRMKVDVPISSMTIRDMSKHFKNPVRSSIINDLREIARKTPRAKIIDLPFAIFEPYEALLPRLVVTRRKEDRLGMTPNLIKDVGTAVSFLHSYGIVLSSLCPENIAFINIFDPVFKIVSLAESRGLSCGISIEPSKVKYMTPDDKYLSTGYDSWCFGVLISYFINGTAEKNYSGDVSTDEDEIDLILGATTKKINIDIPDPYKSWVRSLTHKDPESRLKIHDLLSHVTTTGLNPASRYTGKPAVVESVWPINKKAAMFNREALHSKISDEMHSLGGSGAEMLCASSIYDYAQKIISGTYSNWTMCCDVAMTIPSGEIMYRNQESIWSLILNLDLPLWSKIMSDTRLEGSYPGHVRDAVNGPAALSRGGVEIILNAVAEKVIIL